MADGKAIRSRKPAGNPRRPERLPLEARGRRARTLARTLSEAGVRAVAIAMVDNAGVTRVKSVPVSRLPEAARFGIGLSTVFSVFLVNDDITSSPDIQGPSGDLRLVLDPEACVPLAAMPGWAWAPVDQYDQEGEIWPACGRSFLKRMVEQLGRHRLELRGAFEHEFFLGRRADAGPGGPEEADPAPAHHGPGYSAIVLTNHADLGLDLISTLEEQGLGVQQFHPEYSTGQFEISVAHRDALGAADTSLLVRQNVRGVARRHGLDVSFSPAVYAGLVGNGAHLHFSLWNRGGRNAFTAGRGPHGLSKPGESFLAGVLAELPAIAAVACPSAVSYLRLRPHRWAGAYACWGPENREAALRFVTGIVGDRAAATNMELKIVDPSANPYLVVGSVIAAGLAGVEHELTLPPPITADPDSLGDRERRSSGIRRLPASLGEAIAEMEKSDVLRGAMGDVLFEAFLATRRAEAETYDGMDEEAVARAHRWRY